MNQYKKIFLSIFTIFSLSACINVGGPGPDDDYYRPSLSELKIPAQDQADLKSKKIALEKSLENLNEKTAIGIAKLPVGKFKTTNITMSNIPANSFESIHATYHQKNAEALLNFSLNIESISSKLIVSSELFKQFAEVNKIYNYPAKDNICINANIKEGPSINYSTKTMYFYDCEYVDTSTTLTIKAKYDFYLPFHSPYKSQQDVNTRGGDYNDIVMNIIDQRNTNNLQEVGENMQYVGLQNTNNLSFTTLNRNQRIEEDLSWLQPGEIEMIFDKRAVE